MSTLTARVSRLEARFMSFSNVAQRLYAVAGGQEGSAEAFVRAQGYICDDTDIVAHLVALRLHGGGEGSASSTEPHWAGPRPPEEWKAAA